MKDKLNPKLYTKEMIDRLNRDGHLTTSWIVWKFQFTLEYAEKILIQIAKLEKGIGIAPSRHRIYIIKETS